MCRVDVLYFFRKIQQSLAFQYNSRGKPYTGVTPGEITSGGEQKKEKKRKKATSHPRDSFDTQRCRTMALPRRDMVAKPPEATASAYVHQPGPLPRHPPPRPQSHPARPPRTRRTTRDKTLQGGASKKVSTSAPPPPAPKELRFSPGETYDTHVGKDSTFRTTQSRRRTTP